MGENTMENNEEITCYEGLKFNQKWIVEDLSDGRRKPTDIDWLQVSNGSVDDLKFIAYALQEKAGYNQAVEMVECALYQSKIDNGASEDYIKRVSALLEYWQKIESRYQQPTPSSRTDQPPAEPTTGADTDQPTTEPAPAEPTTGTDTDQQHPEPPAPSIEEETATGSEKEPATAFEIPKFLQSERAKEILKGLESISGANDTQVLDRSKTPWGYSSYKDWGQVAESVTEKLSVRMLWQQWAKLIGVRANTLKTEYHSSKILTETQQRIKDYIKPF